jgi:hypothetical protein
MALASGRGLGLTILAMIGGVGGGALGARHDLSVRSRSSSCPRSSPPIRNVPRASHKRHRYWLA